MTSPKSIPLILPFRASSPRCRLHKVLHFSFKAFWIFFSPRRRDFSSNTNGKRRRKVSRSVRWEDFFEACVFLPFFLVLAWSHSHRHHHHRRQVDFSPRVLDFFSSFSWSFEWKICVEKSSWNESEKISSRHHPPSHLSFVVRLTHTNYQLWICEETGTGRGRLRNGNEWAREILSFKKSFREMRKRKRVEKTNFLHVKVSQHLKSYRVLLLLVAPVYNIYEHIYTQSANKFPSLVHHARVHVDE